MSLEQAITELTAAVKALTAAMEKPAEAVQSFVTADAVPAPAADKPAKPPKPDGVRATPSARPLAAPAVAPAPEPAAEPPVTETPVTETPVTETPVTETSAPAEDPPKQPEAAAPSVETLATALRAAAVRNHQGAVDLLAEFGVRKGADLPEARRAEFIARLESL